MKELQIGEVIYRLRKDKGMTQQQLAKCIGVSTAAISKWESGNSYPDITLLPILAAFLNVTIDTLLNFNNDISDEKVKEIYIECEDLFNESDMNTAIKKTKEYLNKYQSSYFLMSRIAFLYTIYSWKTEDEDKCTQILNVSICTSLGNSYRINEQDYDLAEKYYNLGIETKELFQYNGKTVFLLNEYLQLAQLFINIGNNKKAIEMLKQMIDSYKNHDFTNIEGLKKLWCFDELKQSEYPIRINIYENILALLKQSSFDSIREEKEFKKIFSEIEKFNK